jgi:hypothetical protein
MRIHFLWILLIVGLAACQPSPAFEGDGPRLLEERPLATSAASLPTVFQLPSDTPVLAVTAASTEVADDPIATAPPQGDNRIFVTPTQPPSKTPTVTPSQTTEPTITQTSTITRTPSVTPPPPTNDQFAFTGQGQTNNSLATAVAQGAGQSAQPPPDNPFLVPQGQQNVVAANCTGNPWWFDSFGPPACPSEQPVTGSGVFQRFENGYMVWLEHNDKIYVMYDTAETPRWQIFDDPYIEGDPELDYAWFTYERQPPQSYQPRRGFGEVWRQYDAVRFRIGWAIQEWETVYVPRYQRGEDGSITIEHPDGGLFYLAPRGASWSLYRSY